MSLNVRSQLAQRAADVALRGQRGVLNHRHRCAGGQAGQQLGLNAAGAAHAHVNHQRQTCAVRGGGQGRPVGAGVSRLGMAGDKHHAVRMLAVRQRHAQAGDSGQTGGDAVDDRDLDAGGLQMLALFAATAEDERVAAFEADHILPIARGRDHEFLDEVLRRGLASATLADVDDACTRRRKSDDPVAHQVIDQEHGGGLDGLERFEREQFRITRAGANQRALSAGVWSGVVGLVHDAEFIFSVSCKMCSTCRAIGVGTACRPASTASM